MDRYRFQFLNGNMLKLFALVTMTIDHIGMIMFPRQIAWRLIGRLAFPIFAFMIAEGCYYTRNRKKYVGLIFAIGVLCQIVAFFSQRTLYMCIMITFTFSVLIIFSLQKAIPDRNREENGDKKEVCILWCLITFALIAVIAFLTVWLPGLLPENDFKVDYGFFGVMLPVAVYVPNLFMKNKGASCRLVQVAFMALWLILVWRTCNKYEWIALFSSIPLIFYNGERGKLNLKYLFYIYYPAHLGIIYLINMLR